MRIVNPGNGKLDPPMSRREFLCSLAHLAGWAYIWPLSLALLDDSGGWVLEIDEQKFTNAIRLAEPVLADDGSLYTAAAIDVSAMWAAMSLIDPYGIEYKTRDGETWKEVSN